MISSAGFLNNLILVLSPKIFLKYSAARGTEWVGWWARPSAWGSTAEVCIVPLEPEVLAYVCKPAVVVGFMMEIIARTQGSHLAQGQGRPQAPFSHISTSWHFLTCITSSVPLLWLEAQFKWKASLFPPEIAACLANSSSSLALHWGVSQSPGLFIFHIMCTLIGALQPRNFLRKHRFGLLTILLQTHFAPFLFPLCHR